MDEPVELQTIAVNEDDEHAYDMMHVTTDKTYENLKINTLAEAMTDPSTVSHGSSRIVDRVNVSKPEVGVAAFRKMQIVFAIVSNVLLVMLIITCVTVGILMQQLNRRADTGEIKTDELHAMVSKLQDKLEVQLGPWSLFSPCTATCGAGTHYRKRSCNDSNSELDGWLCPRTDIDIQPCNIGPCQPVHGAWGTWASWTSCSSSCGIGITHRKRECNNPRPSLWGNHCFGESSEYGLCTDKACPVNGHWTDWTIWSGCSVTCGSGHKTRQRYCSNPAPANGGSACMGSTTDQTSCNVMSCPVNGQWSSWTSWSTCNSQICSTSGLSQRHRTCSNPPPSSSGQGCIGDSTFQRICTVAQCDGQVRLVNGTQRSGRIEILYQGIWGTICDDSWDNDNAKVVCRMLGYSGGTAYVKAHFGQGSGRVTLDDVQCTGSESTITACSRNAWLNHNCGHHEDAGVSCT